jgi:hypothetical protein
MPRQTPYRQRRGDALAFRLAFPHDLRSLVGSRELVRTLRTADVALAVPKALRLAACAKTLFSELRLRMSGPDKKKLLDLIRTARHKLEVDGLKDQHADEVLEQRMQHLREVEAARLRERSNILDQLLARGSTPIAAASPAEVTTPAVPESPTLGGVIKDFLD